MMRKKPMLAYPVSDKPIDYSKPTFIQPKLDGVRCLIQYENRPLKNVDDLSGQLTENVVVAYSRTGKEWKNIEHITLNLYKFFNKYPNIILDGELYNHDLRDNFEKIISLVRKTKPTDQDRLDARELTQFHCYDVLDFDGNVTIADFETRMAFVYNKVPQSYCIKHVKTHACSSEVFAKQLHKVNLNDGYEGSIVRTNDTYHCNRSHNLRKFKDFHDTEATIIDWVEGKGKRKGTIGKFVAIDADGNEFGMPVMDKFKYLQKNFEEMKTWVGKIATFTYFERTKANSYRHPLFKCIRNYE